MVSHGQRKAQAPATSSHARTAKVALVIAALCIGLTPASAVTCKQVRGWVATYGKDNVAAYAKWQGWPQRRIDRIARVCRL